MRKLCIALLLLAGVSVCFSAYAAEAVRQERLFAKFGDAGSIRYKGSKDRDATVSLGDVMRMQIAGRTLVYRRIVVGWKNPRSLMPWFRDMKSEAWFVAGFASDTPEGTLITPANDDDLAAIEAAILIKHPDGPAQVWLWQPTAVSDLPPWGF